MRYIFFVLMCSAYSLHALIQLEHACINITPLEVTCNNISHLELVKLLFYFSDEPVVRKITQSTGTHKGMRHEVYTFAQACISDTCKEQLAQLNEHDDPRYYIACKEVKEAKPAIQVDLYYDPQSIMCCVDQCDTITQHKLFALRLIDKKMIDELCQRDTPLIQVAHYHPIAYYRKTSCFLLEKCVIL